MHNQKKDKTNLKTKTNQNCQKIKPYGSLTTKEIKKKHSSRPEGGAETRRWTRRLSKAVAGGPEQVRRGLVDRAVPYLCVDKPGRTTEE